MVSGLLFGMMVEADNLVQSGVILETVGSIWKVQKRALFQYKTVKKGTPNLTSPYIHGLFTIVLIKQLSEKNKSSRTTSGNQEIRLSLSLK